DDDASQLRAARRFQDELLWNRRQNVSNDDEGEGRLLARGVIRSGEGSGRENGRLWNVDGRTRHRPRGSRRWRRAWRRGYVSRRGFQLASVAVHLMSSALSADAEEHGAELPAEDLLAMIDEGRPLLVLDVRNEEEHASWRIEGLRPFHSVHLPYFEFLENPDQALTQIPFDSRPIAVVCAKGGSSSFVAEVLRDAGRHAWNVAGGMAAYGDHLQARRVSLGEGQATQLEIWQVDRRGKGCLSYLIRSADEALVIDP